MSLWTPSGEHEVGGRPDPAQPDDRRQPPGAGGGHDGGDPGGPGPDDLDVDSLRRQLAEAPADVVVANHCYGLFELAAVYLSDSPPRIENAQLAIDALGFLVDGLGGRLGEAHPALRDALAQIRLAFVQISAAQDEGRPPQDGAAGGSSPEGSAG
jgi:hypothetical protein